MLVKISVKPMLWSFSILHGLILMDCAGIKRVKIPVALNMSRDCLLYAKRLGSRNIFPLALCVWGSVCLCICIEWCVCIMSLQVKWYAHASHPIKIHVHPLCHDDVNECFVFPHLRRVKSSRCLCIKIKNCLLNVAFISFLSYTIFFPACRWFKCIWYWIPTHLALRQVALNRCLVRWRTRSLKYMNMYENLSNCSTPHTRF